MRGLTAAFLCVALVAVSPRAGAQDAHPDGENGRYTFNPVPDGVLRLDTRTGQVSKCGGSSAGWTCQILPDDRKALESEIARLQDENVRLRNEFASHGPKLPGDARDDREGEIKLPSDAELDRVMGFIEKVWRRLIDIVESTNKEREKKS